jgi:hypothetical protein
MLGEFPIFWLLIRVSGVAAWLLLTLVVIWGLVLRTRVLGKNIKPATTYKLHLRIGVAALTALTIHLGALLLDPFMAFSWWQLLIPGLSEWRPIPVAFGVLALWVMLPSSVFGRTRSKFGKLGKSLFGISHKISFAAWPLATAHYVFAGTDSLKSWSVVLLALGWLIMRLSVRFAEQKARTWWMSKLISVTSLG